MKSGTVVIDIQMIDGTMPSRVGTAGIAEITAEDIVAMGGEPWGQVLHVSASSMNFESGANMQDLTPSTP